MAEAVMSRHIHHHPPQLLSETQNKPKRVHWGEGLLVLHVRPAKSQTLQHPDLKIRLKDPGTQSRDESRRQMWKRYCSETAQRPPCSMGCFQHAHQKVTQSRDDGWPQQWFPWLLMQAVGPPIPAPHFRNKQENLSVSLFESGFAHDMPIKLFTQWYSHSVGLAS